MSYYLGLKFGKQIYLENLDKYGHNERKVSAKVISTCKEYAFNEKIKKTKSGKRLTLEKRSFYKGVADYLTTPEEIKLK